MIARFMSFYKPGVTGRLPGRPGLSARGGARAAEAASSWAERGGLRRGRWAMVWAVRGRGLGWTWERGRAREKGKSGMRGEGLGLVWVRVGFIFSISFLFLNNSNLFEFK